MLFKSSFCIPLFTVFFPIPIVSTIHRSEIAKVFWCTREEYILTKHRVPGASWRDSHPPLDVLSVVDEILAIDFDPGVEEDLDDEARDLCLFFGGPIGVESIERVLFDEGNGHCKVDTVGEADTSQDRLLGLDIAGEA